jgi:uncharacterized protein YecT (DUF1311 family)
VAQVKEHPIDKQVQKCIDSIGNTTAGMLECGNLEYNQWDAELNRYYKKLMTVLSPGAKIILKEAQVNWLAYRDSEFKLCAAVYNKDGTMWGPIKKQRQVEIVRARAIELELYYQMLTKY